MQSYNQYYYYIITVITLRLKTVSSDIIIISPKQKIFQTVEEILQTTRQR